MKKDDIDRLVNQHWKDQEEDVDSEDEEGPKNKRPFIDAAWFNMLVGATIAANAICIGLETDERNRNRNDGERVSPVWYSLELLFCILFAIELLLRFWFHGIDFFFIPPKLASSGDVGFFQRTALLVSTAPQRARYSNLLDFVIVFISVLDAFVLSAVGAGGGARFVSMLRFLRLMRLIRLVRLFKIFKELWLVASGLINAMKTLLWVCLMIFIVCYIAGIFATLWVGQNDDQYDGYYVQTGWDHEIYFASVGRSIFTLIQVITLDGWADDIARHVVKNQPPMIIFFIIVIGVVTFGLLNIIVGVVVENALSTAARDERRVRRAEEANRQLVFGQLREIFEAADVDQSGTLTFDEVESAISKPEIYNKLKMIDFPVENPKQMFDLLDYDDSGELTIDEFIMGCLRMKGNAKAKDLLVAQVALDTMKRHFAVFEQEQTILQMKLRRLDATARAITDHGERVFLDMQQYRARHPGERGTSIPRLNTVVMQKSPWEQDEEDWLVEDAGNDSDKMLANLPVQHLDRLPWTPEEKKRPIADAAPPPRQGPPPKALMDGRAAAPPMLGNGRHSNDLQLAVPGSLDN